MHASLSAAHICLKLVIFLPLHPYINLLLCCFVCCCLAKSAYHIAQMLMSKILVFLCCCAVKSQMFAAFLLTPAYLHSFHSGHLTHCLNVTGTAAAYTCLRILYEEWSFSLLLDSHLTFMIFTFSVHILLVLESCYHHLPVMYYQMFNNLLLGGSLIYSICQFP